MGGPKILISAGEASGDYYASILAMRLRDLMPGARFFGCAGPKMRQAGVEAVVESESLSVVGLVEVVRHIPRVYGEFRKVAAAAQRERPVLAILTDSPDFHLRLAKKLKANGIPVIYLIAPQVWAWRKWRLAAMRRGIDRLLCIFPFEEAFFRQAGIRATYIGHPLAAVIGPKLDRAEFFRKHRLAAERPLVTLLPGSRVGEAGRHLPALLEAVDAVGRARAASFVWAAPAGFFGRAGGSFFRERIARSPIQVIEGETWDAIAHADLALAASGTVAVEAALLATPMITYYRVSGLSWLAGKFLVDVPHYTMVNLVAGRKVVPELMQDEMTGQRLAGEALRLLGDAEARERMREGLREVRALLGGLGDPLGQAARMIYDEFVVQR